MKSDILIVGGGVIGSSIALHLRRKSPKTRVHVLERDGTYARASSMLALGGIRQQYTSKENVALAQHSIAWYRGLDLDLKAANLRARADLRQRGYLFLGDRAAAPRLRERAALASQAGAEVEIWDRSEVSRRYPGTHTDDIEIAVFGPPDGYAQPKCVLAGLRALAERAGARYIPAEVDRVVASGGRVIGVALKDGEVMESPVVVNAAGAFGAAMFQSLGMGVPIQPQRQQLFFLKPGKSLPFRLPMMVDPTGVHWRHDDPLERPDGERVIVAGSVHDEPFGANFSVDFGLWHGQWRAIVEHRLPQLRGAELVHASAGHYEVTPDHNPLLGADPRLPGLFHAAGFSGHGLMLAPAVGLVLAESILGTPPSFSISPFAPDRFDRGQPFNDAPMI